MPFYPFFLTAEIRGKTMVGSFCNGTFLINWDWRPYHSRLREIDVNYRYAQHNLPFNEGQQILRVLHTRGIDHGELYWVEMSALRYWLQHRIVLGDETRGELRHFYRNRMPGFLSVPTVVT